MGRLGHLLGALLLAALVLALPAGAVSSPPELDIYVDPSALSKPADTELVLVLPAANGPVATVALYVPQGYGMTLAAPVGTKIADAQASAIVKATSPTAVVSGKGALVADDPAKYAADPRAQACAPGTHAAAWLLTLSISGQTVTVQFFADPATGPDAAIGAFKITACLQTPDLPIEQGGAPAGTQLTALDLDFAKTFTNPTQPKEYLWRAFVTPFTAGTPTANPAAAVETNAHVPLPETLTLHASYDPTSKKAVLTGRLLAAGKARSGVNIHFESSPKPDFTSFKSFGVATTRADGTFVFQKRVLRTVYIVAVVNPYFGTCTDATTAPGGCARSTISPPGLEAALVKVPKKKA